MPSVLPTPADAKEGIYQAWLQERPSEVAEAWSAAPAHVKSLLQFQPAAEAKGRPEISQGGGRQPAIREPEAGLHVCFAI